MATIESDISNYLNAGGEPLPAYSEGIGPAASSSSLDHPTLTFLPQERNARRPLTSDILDSFFEAIRNGQDDIVHLILTEFKDQGITPNSRHPVTGQTPLGAACKAGHISVVSLLLNSGAEVDTFSIEGKYRELEAAYEKHMRRKQAAALKKAKKDGKNRSPANWSYYIYEFDGYTLRPEFHILRTPLMVACECGYIPIVKMLISPPCNADDEIVAPDGQIALRLAVANGHKEIVALLPSRRAGGWKRFKHGHARSILKIKETTLVLRTIAKHLVWDLPKALFITFPIYLAKKVFKALKHLVTKTIPRAAIATARGVKKACLFTVNELPGIVAKKAKAAAKGTKRFFMHTLPTYTVQFFKWLKSAIISLAKKTLKFLTSTLPKAIKHFFVEILWKTLIVGTSKAIWKFSKWLWNFLVKLITVKIPNVAIATGKLVKQFCIATMHLLVKFFEKVLSFLHTCFSYVVALVQRLANITFADVLNSLNQIVQFLFVTVPVSMWKGICIAYDSLFRAVVYLFGFVGWFVMGTIHCLGSCVAYVVKVVLKVVAEIGRIVGRGLHEVTVWVDPKSGGR